MTSVVVIGGGLVGLATARALCRAKPNVSVTVLEKERDVAAHQSSHNSGVLHAGLYYAPGSTKARLAVRGIRQMRAFCEQHAIPHEICGKVVVATEEREVQRLRDLLERGTRNGLAGLTWLTADALREIEPHVAGVAAVRVPEEGIVDYPAVARAMVRDITESGATVRTGARVRAIEADSGAWRLVHDGGEERADYIVNCAGLHCDRVAQLAGERPDIRIVPFRGEYWTLRADRTHLVRHLVYPVPDPAFPFLGVHFTRMIGGGVECGPNAVLAFAREGYSKRRVNVRDLAGTAVFPGLWRFLLRYPAMSAMELYRSFSKRAFTTALQRLVPELRTDDLAPGGAGVRAQAMTRDGRLVQDFHFLQRANALHVLNAPSPGATASLAIGEEIVGRVGDALD